MNSLSQTNQHILGRIKHPKKLISVRTIGHGAFGTVVLMKDPYDNDRMYAIKRESKNANPPQLMYEFRIYKKLLNVKGIPTAYVTWKDDDYLYMAMDLLGPSLDKLIKKIIPWDVMNWIFPKALKIMEELHNKQFLHRDIKPENLLTGTGELRGRDLFLVDFGLSKRYRTTSLEHIPFKNEKSLTGTIRYASVNTHNGIEQSRRDDLESLGYVMLFLLKKRLPWMNLNISDTKLHNQRVREIKESISVNDLCENAPPAFKFYFNYVKSLKFNEDPDYALLSGYIKHRE